MKRFIILLICVATLISACNKREHEQLPIIENGTAVSVSDIEFNPFGSDFTLPYRQFRRTASPVFPSGLLSTV